MNKRFDLEQRILDCWHITADLDTLLENVIENDMFDRDDISNVVLGLHALYELKFDKCFRTFEEVSKEHVKTEQELKWFQEKMVAKELQAVEFEHKLDELRAQLLEQSKPKARKKVKK